MANPLRVRLLAMLEERPQSPVKLAAALDLSVNVVAYHVKRLAAAGLIELVETHKRRGATEHVYASRHRALFGHEAWDRLDRESRTQLLFPILQQMADYANRAARAGGFDRADSHFTRWTLKVDEEGWRELAERATEWVEQATAIEARVAERGATPCSTPAWRSCCSRRCRSAPPRWSRAPPPRRRHRRRSARRRSGRASWPGGPQPCGSSPRPTGRGCASWSSCPARRPRRSCSTSRASPGSATSRARPCRRPGARPVPRRRPRGPRRVMHDRARDPSAGRP